MSTSSEIWPRGQGPSWHRSGCGLCNFHFIFFVFVLSWVVFSRVTSNGLSFLAFEESGNDCRSCLKSKSKLPYNLDDFLRPDPPIGNWRVYNHTLSSAFFWGLVWDTVHWLLIFALPEAWHTLHMKRLNDYIDSLVFYPIKPPGFVRCWIWAASSSLRWCFGRDWWWSAEVRVLWLEP